MSLVDSVRAGLAALEPIDVRDRAMADLAVLLAERIVDHAEWADKQRDPLSELATKLMQALDRLGMNPAARKTVIEAKPAAAKSPLDELRERRAARVAT